jgi:hypothetical protein
MNEMKPKRFPRLPSDTADVLHLKKDEGARYWQKWDHEKQEWSDVYTELGVTISLGFGAVSGDKELTILLHTGKKTDRQQERPSLWKRLTG